MDEPKVIGMDKWIARLQAMKAGLRGEILRKGIMTAATKAKTALEAAAPVGDYPGGRQRRKGKKQAQYGPIRSNIIIYERKRPDLWTQAESDNALSLLVGINKKAFYGFFQEKGWIPHKRTSKIRRVRTASGERKTIHTGGGEPVRGKFWKKGVEDTMMDQFVQAGIDVVKKAIEGS